MEHCKCFWFEVQMISDEFSTVKASLKVFGGLLKVRRRITKFVNELHHGNNSKREKTLIKRVREKGREGR